MTVKANKSYEVRVNTWVEDRLQELSLDYHVENDMPQQLVDALRGASKHGLGTGRPDFSVSLNSKTNIAVVIENKWRTDRLKKESRGKISTSAKDVKDYAVNGAVFYARNIIESGIYDEVIAVGVSGDESETGLVISGEVYYVYDSESEPKLVNDDLKDFKFLEDSNFDSFYDEAKLNDKEKHLILISTYKDLKKKSSELNNLMNARAIIVDQRVIYVSGMLLAMKYGLVPAELKGEHPNTPNSDGKKIYMAIESHLYKHGIPKVKIDMMLSIFNAIQTDGDRDLKRVGRTDAKGNKLDERSVNAEVFNFIYNNIFLTIDNKSHIDTLGEMYSEFLKYALGDGKENGIVLTPPYVTKLMNQLIETDMNSKMIDLCTGSGGFLVSAMDTMIDDARDKFKYDEEGFNNKVKEIKQTQLFGVELDMKMFTLAATNMILRGDGSSRMIKDSAFEVVKTEEAKNYKANKGLLNPPFNYSENGMPFALEALNIMDKGGKLAIIIQDSAGSGKANLTNSKILKSHSLIASIKMPMDLFQPSAGVQTSIYILEAHKPHDVRTKVRFIDFRNDGYKRTGRGLSEVENPQKKYLDILDVFISGDSNNGIDCVDSQISLIGNDWNYEKHAVYDTVPTDEDFEKTVGDYLMFQISELLGGR